jgi:hypothetical protein
MNSKPYIKVSHVTLTDNKLPEKIRLELLNTDNTNVFLSSCWLESFLNLNKDEKILVIAEINERFAGAGLLIIKNKYLFRLFKLKQCFLHRYGVENLDQIWIENNDFLIKHVDRETVREALVEYILSINKVDELIFGLTDAKIINSLKNNKLKSYVEMESIGYQADLTNCNCLADYFKSISKNTRAQINRTRKLLEDKSALTLQEANTPKQKLEFFTDAGKIHLDRWGDSDYGSGFTNTHFIDFHKRLLNENNEHNCTKIFKLSHGDACLGYIYILTEVNSWLFYLSAINFHPDKRIKVGLLFHSMLIEKAIEENISNYDFLAGDARYKQSLSNCPHYLQQLTHFYKSNFLLNTLNLCRHWKLSLKNKVTKLSRLSEFKSTL